MASSRELRLSSSNIPIFRGTKVSHKKALQTPIDEAWELLVSSTTTPRPGVPTQGRRERNYPHGDETSDIQGPHFLVPTNKGQTMCITRRDFTILRTSRVMLRKTNCSLTKTFGPEFACETTASSLLIIASYPNPNSTCLVDVDHLTMSTPPPSKRNRVRNETQLNQKRLADRVKHRENRHENKQRIERIENDIADIKASLQSLTHLFQATPASPAATTTEPVLSLVPGLGELSGSVPSASPLFLHLSPQHHPAFSAATLASASATRFWRGMPLPDSTKIINCRCGSQHFDRFDTIDYCTITALYQWQTTFPTGQHVAEALPRNPSLPAMMLHSMEENTATSFITGFLRQYRSKSIEQLMGFYLLGYRYMRWRMRPDASTLQDVPAWLLPTDIQKSHPHSVVVDYLPWPLLRDYLCKHANGDPRHSINFYFESMELIWPPDYPLFAQDDAGQVSISPEFEMVISNLENWTIGPPWSNAFPHLMHLIRG
ncbi:hypothetical protein B0J13DRAFT_534098 [Dactylonectria estremocensis]|uniref:BZIP domain-containing protein n=1 Tax=Dactylonectria estremocensis TaxID=1079267 RepID=A0A9P9D4M1_9HYPO|nr:hypothetical protein B0J13DRAFT_534098 [Dactylonectria estremocensis]